MISTIIDGSRFNFRVSGLFIDSENKRFLTNIGDGLDYCVLPGGRVEINEPTDLTLSREIEEELGEKISISYLKTICENFFEFDRQKVHELQFMYVAKFENKDFEKIKGKFKGVENKDFYEWRDISELEKLKFEPQMLKKSIFEVFENDSTFERLSNFV